MKNLIYFILAITLLSVSCSKKDDGNVTPTPVTKTPGQLHPEYLGKWHCDSVYTDGKLNYFVTGNNYEFQDTKCINTDDKNLSVHCVYDNWTISGTTLSLNIIDDNTPYTMTIIKAPTNNKMVLLDFGYTEYLTKQ